MVDIYDEFARATPDLWAYVVLRSDGEYVAKVVIKRSKSGLRKTAYLHVLGSPMVKGVATGGGYDMSSAAVSDAARKLAAVQPTGRDPDVAYYARINLDIGTLAKYLYDADRTDWTHKVRDAGYAVWQVV